MDLTVFHPFSVITVGFLRLSFFLHRQCNLPLLLRAFLGSLLGLGKTKEKKKPSSAPPASRLHPAGRLLEGATCVCVLFFPPQAPLSEFPSGLSEWYLPKSLLVSEIRDLSVLFSLDLTAVFTTGAHFLPRHPWYITILVFFSVPWPPSWDCVGFSPFGVAIGSPFALLFSLFLGEATRSRAWQVTSIG